ncbi:MAG: hypothetical protein KHY44_06065 [Clostridiales bacterium]|nr:hypothetical protein [Clostridiales bacterium]
MIKLEHTDVMNFENAIRGMRNPMNSWDKSDSYYGCWGGGKICSGCTRCEYRECYNANRFYYIGPNDLGLAQRLCKAGSDHRKFLRQIFVSVDITAPLYWWKEYDTYKVGTTANSCSTMHKIHAEEFEIGDFSCERMLPSTKQLLWLSIIPELNDLRDNFNKTKDKDVWYAMIQLLPSSYNQMRTCTMTYENLRNIYHARKKHKLDEWHTLCEWIETLPYAQELIVGDET